MDKKNLRIQIQEASFSLLNHGVIAFPTETVMGLGVVYNDKEAYDHLNFIKHRPDDHPYTMMLSGPDQIENMPMLILEAPRLSKHLCQDQSLYFFL